MWVPIRRCTAFAGPDSVVKGGALSLPPSFHTRSELVPPSLAVFAFANVLGVEDTVLFNTTTSEGTGNAAHLLFPALSFAMGDLMSLSVLQILSVLSFLTSLFAVVRVGAGSLHRFSHKFEANLNRPPSDMNIADGKAPLWNWNLSGSFSLGSLIGEDEEEEVGRSGGYTGGSDLMRMDWQVSRAVSGMPQLVMVVCSTV